ncbi:caspase family protein [Flammeovirga sp. EKP202]|uniref:caspase family protein n=1 Tax=Flammeovirga sp. EKP202 TaxID=2770592 RepID=UPI00165FE6C7|nr:caspase family protein [Flammeovirga sp. EKP202]MBD0401285.1 caspase family protein [Flammeovirga sp. EKP202]
MTLHFRKILFLLYFLLFNLLLSNGQTTRSVVINPAYEHEFQGEITSRKYALFIGTDDYDYFNTLNNPINDIEEVSRLLADKYAFNTKILKNPDANQVLSTIKQYRTLLKPNDRFLLYIAGHGTYDNIHYKEGFLVMKETKNEALDPNLLTYLPFQYIKNITDNLPSRQVMLVVDVCFGGAFNDQIQRNRSGASRNYHWNANVFLTNQLKEKGRFVMSSGRLNPVPDGDYGQHSPFAADFIKALEINANDSIVTAQKIQLELQTLASNPIFGYYGETKGITDFVFKARSSTSKVNEQERIDILVNMYYAYLKGLSLEFSKKLFLNSVQLQKIANEFYTMARNGNVEASFWVTYMNHCRHGIQLSQSEVRNFSTLAYETFKKEHTEMMNDEHIFQLTILQSEGIVPIENHQILQEQITSSVNIGSSMSSFYAGRYCKKRSNLKRAYFYFLNGAKEGNAFCQYELSSLIYRQKEELEKLGYVDLDYKKWLLKASQNGLRRAKDVIISQGLTE